MTQKVRSAKGPLKSWSKWWIWAGLVVAIISVAGVMAFRGYPVWKRERLLGQARTAIEHSQWRTAFLALQQVIRVSPDNLEGVRMMAGLMNRLRIPQSIFWHRRLAELEPDVAEHYIKWARAALEHREYALAEVALSAFSVRDQRNPAYHHLRSALHLATKQQGPAEQEASEALRLDPTNLVYRLNLATIRLGGNDVAARESARKVLAEMAAAGNQRVEALRALAMDEISQGHPREALKNYQQIVASPAATIGDRLQYLHLQSRLDEAEAAKYLEQLQKEIRTKPADILELTNWLLASDRTEQCLRWLESLSQDVRDQAQTQMAIINCLSRKGDWAEVEVLLRKSDWEEMDFLRVATLARAYKERGSLQKAELQWNTAVNAASARGEALHHLVRVVSAWKWEKETEELLWVIGRGRYNPKHALQALYRYYQAGGDAQGLYRVLTRMIEIDPEDAVAKNNYAALALLLKINLAKAHQLAAELYAKDGKNPVFVSTHAFSLHLQGRTSQGRKLMESLEPSLLQQPEIAAYYGILLAADGARDIAGPFLERAKGAKLLPQERDLVEQAAKPGA